MACFTPNTTTQKPNNPGIQKVIGSRSSRLPPFVASFGCWFPKEVQRATLKKQNDILHLAAAFKSCHTRVLLRCCHGEAIIPRVQTLFQFATDRHLQFGAPKFATQAYNPVKLTTVFGTCRYQHNYTEDYWPNQASRPTWRQLFQKQICDARRKHQASWSHLLASTDKHSASKKHALNNFPLWAAAGSVAILKAQIFFSTGKAPLEASLRFSTSPRPSNPLELNSFRNFFSDWPPTPQRAQYKTETRPNQPNKNFLHGICSMLDYQEYTKAWVCLNAGYLRMWPFIINFPIQSPL